jgi:hypothetical protein
MKDITLIRESNESYFIEYGSVYTIEQRKVPQTKVERPLNCAELTICDLCELLLHRESFNSGLISHRETFK